MPTPQPTRQATALIVDDDDVMRLLEYETLSQFDFVVHEASDAQAALALLSTLVPDLLLLDVDMPGMNGFELCRRVRQRWDMTRLPIIMVTGMDDLDSINEAYQSGANDFVSKPINWPILGHRARYVLRSAQAVRELHELKEKQAAIVQAIPDTIFLTDRRGTYLDFKAGFGATPGLAPDAIVDRHVAEILPGEVAELVLRAIERTLQEGRIESLVYKLPLADGLHHYEARLAPSGADKVVIVVRDITLQKLNEDRIRRLAYFDTLTGMPNRQSFLERLDDELLRARRQGRVVALLFLDLDGFKRVNDTLGHSVGDQLLQAVADRLKERLRGGDFVARPALDGSGTHLARLGGDEFTVVLSHLEDAQVVGLIADRLQAILGLPFHIGAQEVTVTSSIGIALFPGDGDDASTLLKHADTAMYHAKALGRNNWQLYDRSLTTAAVRRLALENDMRKGIERDEFRLFYQPQVLAADGTIVGVEALLRWQHPEHGLVSPGEFIPVAEDSGLMVPLGEWVLRTACRQLVAWQERGAAVPRVAVNVSATQVRGADFIGTVASIIDETGIDANRLELELTESILMDPDMRRIEGLSRLRARGVHFSIDDFGTGYSSLSYVKRFPISMLKIDQSFVRGLPESANDAGITTAIIAMARSLGLEVIAEGVENSQQADFLRRAQCDKLQGYLFSRPLPPDEVERLLLQGRI
jgi:diguanylate cyclase (GGDEF)-like protein/PAS domain S-box-containing protein